MKTLLSTFTALLICCICYAQKENESLTYQASYNGKTHTVQVGDTVQLGYGSTPYGSFMYIYNSSPPKGLGKEFARKSGVVYKVKYIKSLSQSQIYIKGRFGTYIVDLPQAIEKEEVIGFNQTTFK